MKAQLALSLAALALMVNTLSPSGAAFASESLDQGMKCYKEKNYQEAKKYLEQAAKEDPKSWQAHFYLGHTLMSLGRVADAKYQYETTKRVSNHPGVKAHCDKALAQVTAYYSKMKPAPVLKKTASAGGGGSDEDEMNGGDEAKKEGDKKAADAAPLDKRAAEIKAKRDAILNKAKEECDKIKKEADAQIEQEKNNPNMRFRNPDGGEGISKAREAEIKKEAEDKCKRIMGDAENRARGYR